VIEQSIAKALPLWNQTLTQVTNDHNIRPRVEVQGDGYLESPLYDFPEEHDGEIKEDFYRRCDEVDDLRKARTVLQPEPKRFQIPADRLHDKAMQAPEVDLRKNFGKPQIIVKLANIQLTPENPSHSGGSWHVEG
jgi:hypothetical protein